MTKDKKKITQKYLEFCDDGRIRSYIERYLTTDMDGKKHDCSEEWDVDWCNRDQCYYIHNIGGGHYDPAPKTDRKFMAVGLGFDLWKLPVGEDHTTWCETCKDWLPDDTPCEHMDWCDECGEVVEVKTHRTEHPDHRTERQPNNDEEKEVQE